MTSTELIVYTQGVVAVDWRVVIGVGTAILTRWIVRRT